MTHDVRRAGQPRARARLQCPRRSPTPPASTRRRHRAKSQRGRQPCHLADIAPLLNCSSGTGNDDAAAKKVPPTFVTPGGSSSLPRRVLGAVRREICGSARRHLGSTTAARASAASARASAASTRSSARAARATAVRRPASASAARCAASAAIAAAAMRPASAAAARSSSSAARASAVPARATSSASRCDWASRHFGIEMHCRSACTRSLDGSGTDGGSQLACPARLRQREGGAPCDDQLSRRSCSMGTTGAQNDMNRHSQRMVRVYLHSRVTGGANSMCAQGDEIEGKSWGRSGAGGGARAVFTRAS